MLRALFNRQRTHNVMVVQNAEVSPCAHLWSCACRVANEVSVHTTSASLQVSCLFLSLLALLYVSVRAFRVGATYDEVSTIWYLVPESVVKIFTLTTGVKTPDHVLNTLSIKLLFAMGYENLFVARLPNVAAFAIYLYFSYRIAGKLDSVFHAAVVFLLLICNPFLLDFFGLARGYGMALGAQMVSTYYLLAFLVEPHPRRSLTVSLMAAAISVLCVFSWLHYFLAVAAVGFWAALLYRRPVALFAAKLILLISAGLGLALYRPIERLERLNMFFYGGQRDFYHDTLVSLAKYTTYTPDATPSSLLALDLFLFILAAVVCISLFRPSRLKAASYTFTALLLLPVLSTVAQHYILGTPYLIDRIALFFYPLVMLALCFGINSAVKQPYSFLLLGAVGLVLSLNLLRHGNFYKVALWSFDARSQEILAVVNDAGAANQTIKRLDFAWPFEQSTKYHWGRGYFPFVQIVEHPEDADDFNPKADYYIYLGRSLEKYEYDPAKQKVLAQKKQTFLCFDEEAICVFKLQ